MPTQCTLRVHSTHTHTHAYAHGHTHTITRMHTHTHTHTLVTHTAPHSTAHAARTYARTHANTTHARAHSHTHTHALTHTQASKRTLQRNTELTGQIRPDSHTTKFCRYLLSHRIFLFSTQQQGPNSTTGLQSQLPLLSPVSCPLQPTRTCMNLDLLTPSDRRSGHCLQVLWVQLHRLVNCA